MLGADEPILKLRDVETHFAVRKGVFQKVAGHVKAVDGINLDVMRGEVLGVVGESGCGKTTLGKSILQLIRPTGGEIIYYDGGSTVELRKLSDEEMQPYRKKLQIVFQDPHSSLNPAFTIFGSLQDPLKRYGIKSRAERRKIIGDLLEAVNLRRDYMDRYPHEFSGGQRQRIGIARALCVDPELIVCDEAVSALDVSIQAQVLELLMRLKKERNLTYIFITHDLSVTEYLCDRIAVMYLGRIVELAYTEDLYANTLHPYTQALLSAIPVADLDKKSNRIVLQGDVPSPLNPPSGCPFHPRCRHATYICRSEVPVLSNFSEGPQEHLAACHRIGELER
jgi:peptide/nickel transport system ATP-binding protein/oligopeptide transport system ATP-binding protein